MIGSFRLAKFQVVWTKFTIDTRYLVRLGAEMDAKGGNRLYNMP